LDERRRRENDFTLWQKKCAQYFQRHMGEFKTETQASLGDRPTLIGEFGIPFDFDNGAFQSGDFSDQAAALDRSVNAMEANMLSYTLWNYSPDNDNLRGDQWNGEDFFNLQLEPATR